MAIDLSSYADKLYPQQGQAPDTYADDLLGKAEEVYPFIKNHDPIVVKGSTGEDYAETWPKNEEGPPGPNGESTRPSEFPMDRVGVMIGKPGQFSHHDLAGELLHVDEVANKTRESLSKSWSEAQLKTLKDISLDYEQTLQGKDEQGNSRPESDAIRNATDAAIRGKLLKQWPDESNDRLKYSADQTRLLDKLKSYMTTGKTPGITSDKSK